MTLTAKQEGFSQCVASGMSLSNAYRANYRCAHRSAEALWVDASRLAANPKVALRIEELRALVTDQAVERLVLSKEKIIQDLLDNVRMMREPIPLLDDHRQPILDREGRPVTMTPTPAHIQAANRALELLGKELGMFIERKEVRTGALDEMTEEELKAKAEELAGRLGFERKRH